MQPRALFQATVAGIILYAILDIIAQLLPPHYSPVSQAESDLAVGPYGYIMAINFVNRGVLSILFVVGLSRIDLRKDASFRTGRAFLLIWGVGALILALSPTDLPGAHPTIHGLIHLVTAFVAFLGGAFGILLLSINFRMQKRLGQSRKYLLTLAVLSLTLVVLTFLGLATRIGGLLERLFLGSVLLWILIVSIYFVKYERLDSGEPKTNDVATKLR
jgi:hypothetical membrane protein